jgi:hypothetical protein
MLEGNSIHKLNHTSVYKNLKLGPDCFQHQTMGIFHFVFYTKPNEDVKELDLENKSVCVITVAL